MKNKKNKKKKKKKKKKKEGKQEIDNSAILSSQSDFLVKYFQFSM